MSALACYVVGEGLLALETLGALVQRGFCVAGVLSQDECVARFCSEHGLAHYTQRAAFVSQLSERGLDLLFSVNNPWIVPDDVLALPRVAAINFHDAPLPRYGGVFATSWALLNGETSHGVSWHVMRSDIDAGDILARRSVPVLPEDTAHTLNVRCFEAAKEALAELLDALPLKTLRGTPQSGERAHYHGLRDRPWAGGLLDFRRDAASLQRTVRALDFGPALNPFAAAKCMLGEELLLVRKAQVATSSGSAAPGVCVGLDEHGLSVQTGDGLLVLTELCDVQGRHVEAQTCARQQGVSPGKPLAQRNEEALTALDGRFRELARHEAFWVQRLLHTSPVRSVLPPTSRREGAKTWPLARFARTLRDLPADVPRTALVAAFAARLCAAEASTLGWALPEQSAFQRRFFASVLPWQIPDQDLTVTESLALAAEQLAQLKRRGTYARDLIARTPALRQHGEPHYELAIMESDLHDPAGMGQAVDLLFVMGADAQPYLVSYTQLPDEQLAALDDALATFARAALRMPNARVADLPLLSAEQLHTMLRGWNATHVELPALLDLPSLFAEQAQRTPRAVAVRSGATVLTYRSLEEQSSQLACALRRRGVTNGARVLVSLPHSAELVVAFMAVMKAGATYVPCDPQAPEGRRIAMLTGARPTLVLCCKEDRALFAAHAPCAEPDELRDQERAANVTSQAAGERARHVAPEDAGDAQGAPADIAYIIFTSGSTGAPKGVEVTQRGLCNHALAMARLYRLGPGDRVLCSASIGFDVCGEQIYPALLHGAEVVMRPGDLFESLSRFDAFLRSARITVAVLPTGFWQEWVRGCQALNLGLPPALRAVGVGTEKVLASTLAAFDRLADGKVEMLQGYGPTEATITCAVYRHAPGSAAQGGEIPIGRPLANMQAYVLDARMRPVPVGVAGELYVGGVGVARGYLAAPELTSQRFVPSPFCDAERLYRTGDRAYYRSDGQLVFLGRSDNQVKLRGYRVELGEIEAALNACSGVAESSVHLWQEAGSAPRLMGYVVPADGAEVDAQDLRQQLAVRLPSYMVPSEFVLLKALPRTLHQKLDRAALPPPAAQSARAKASSQLEQALCELVAQLAGRHDVSPEHDFFRDLGGDSLSAVRLLARIEAAHGVELSLSDFVHEPTVRWLSSRLGQRSAAQTHEQDYVVLQAGEAKCVPLWLLPAVGGHVVYGEHLRKGLAPTQTVYGLEARGLRRAERPFDRIEAMAEHYLRIISRVQPRGPYVVAGPSLGGLAAWEVAQRLERRGQRACVVLFDTWGPGYPRPVSALERLLDQSKTVLKQRAAADLYRLVADRLRLRLHMWSGVPRYTGADHVDGVRGERIREVVRCSSQASEAYRPSAYGGEVLLFHGKRTPAWSGMRFEGDDNGWRGLAPRLQIEHVDADHVALSDRPSESVGRRLQQLLDQLAAQPEPAPRNAARPRRLSLARPRV